jgi:hypothetical protein
MIHHRGGRVKKRAPAPFVIANRERSEAGRNPEAPALDCRVGPSGLLAMTGQIFIAKLENT